MNTTIATRTTCLPDNPISKFEDWRVYIKAAAASQRISNHLTEMEPDFKTLCDTTQAITDLLTVVLSPLQ